jgi:excisionase family DNA binding protein
MSMDDKFFTINEVSQYLKIPKSTIYKLSQKGEIPSIKIGKQIRFRKSSLDKWLTEKESKTAVLSNKKKHQILLIDDDRLVLTAIARLLTANGYIVEPTKALT